MKKLAIYLLIFVSIVVVTGCVKKPAVAREDSSFADAKAKAEAEETARKEAEARAKADAEAKSRKEAEEKAARDAEIKAKAELEEKRRKDAEAIRAFRPEDIHFDYDKADIKERDRETLKSLAEWLLNNKGSKIQIEGHCDERGSNEYNLALGDRRAHSAKQYLLTLGVSESRISAISYGEEKPLCSESSEDCWGKNRRGHFAIQEATLAKP